MSGVWLDHAIATTVHRQDWVRVGIRARLRVRVERCLDGPQAGLQLLEQNTLLGLWLWSEFWLGAWRVLLVRARVGARTPRIEATVRTPPGLGRTH